MISLTKVDHTPIEIWSEIGWVRRRIETARRVFLFLDFDGTLAPIVSVPSLAMLPEDLRIVLRALSAKSDVVTTIISGRAVEDLQHRVALPLIYVGNHGLEIRGPGLDYTVSEAKGLRFQLLEVGNRLRATLEPFKGVLVECKMLSASVHMRQVDPVEKPEVITIFEESMQHYPAFQITRGKEVFDIRPNIPWNKGSAARWILHKMHGEDCGVICIGDDSTDEDMFAEFSDGITIRAGLQDSTTAKYWVGETEVLRFLHCVLQATQESGSPFRTDAR